MAGWREGGTAPTYWILKKQKGKEEKKVKRLYYYIYMNLYLFDFHVYI